MVCESPNSPNNAIGGVATDAGNVIAFNGASGVLIYGASAIGNAIRSNSIFSNADLGIDLEADGIRAARRSRPIPPAAASRRTIRCSTKPGLEGPLGFQGFGIYDSPLLGCVPLLACAVSSLCITKIR